MIVRQWMICTYWCWFSGTDARPNSWRRSKILVTHLSWADTPTSFVALLRQRRLSLVPFLDLQATGEKNGQRGNRDRRLPPDHLRVDPGVIHPAYRLLEGVLCGRDGHHHSDLLVQPVEDMRDRFNWGVQLQGLPFHVGSGWWVRSFRGHRDRNLDFVFFRNCCCLWMKDQHC